VDMELYSLSAFKCAFYCDALTFFRARILIFFN